MFGPIMASFWEGDDEFFEFGVAFWTIRFWDIGDGTLYRFPFFWHKFCTIHFFI